jgi:hypothetical protein
MLEFRLQAVLRLGGEDRINPGLATGGAMRERSTGAVLPGGGGGWLDLDYRTDCL